MWHEARRQERKIRGMLVDYRRRAERRRDFYEKIKADPTQFLQVHGRQCKLHLDPAIANAGDSAVTMMPWQGQTDNLIDRFDVRAHLDYIPPYKKTEDEPLTLEERQINYERYRIVAQNSFLAITEEKFLKQLHMEEQYGYTESKTKKDRTGGAVIGFNYEDGTGQMHLNEPAEDESDGHSDSDLDVDLSINVSKMDSVQAHEMNRHGRNFGMSSNDFYSFLTNDLEEAESFRQAKEEEHEKALFSGRKSRRERRAHREKRLANRVISPPSYAARSSPTYPLFRDSKSPSKSPSPEVSGKITYITSFGDEEETPSTSKPTYADKVKYGKPKNYRKSNENLRNRKSYSRERSYSSRKRKSRSLSRSRSRSRIRYRRSRTSSRNRRAYRRRSPSTSSSSSSLTSTSSSSSSTDSSTPTRSSRSRSRSYQKTKRQTSSSSSHTSKSSKKIGRGKSKTPPTNKSPPKVLPRYYGRKKSDQSSSELSDASVKNDDDENKSNNEKWSGQGNSSAVIKKTGQNLSIQERLKRKRQALLNKQYKADKIAEQLKTEREKQEQQNREEELREMAIKLRRRQREKRHAYDSSKSSSDSDSDSSRSSVRRGNSSSPPRKTDRELKNNKRSVSRERRSSPIRGSPKRYIEKRPVYRDRKREEHSRWEFDKERGKKDDHERNNWDGPERTRRDDRLTKSLVDY